MLHLPPEAATMSHGLIAWRLRNAVKNGLIDGWTALALILEHQQMRTQR